MDTAKRLLKPVPISIFSDCYGAGKSTVAAILTKHFSNIVILSFAAPLKNMAAVFFSELGFAPEVIGHLLSPEGKLLKDSRVDRVLNGKEGTAMQAFKNTLSDTDLAAVITYERNSFGNKKGDLIQPAQIKSLR